MNFFNKIIFTVFVTTTLFFSTFHSQAADSYFTVDRTSKTCKKIETSLDDFLATQKCQKANPGAAFLYVCDKPNDVLFITQTLEQCKRLAMEMMDSKEQ